ncbi:unnamed protein product [Cylicocyclus nassatus]|uniref:Major facilitator superfamily (MFS) profile domain-containing protein n=1 Tax=Cylicocyclus nassatus TaxID=53992 RepID=A0AA36M4H0_CYLNA|nr:unnamed protein product [Cylicocyclus nassatus]
MIEGEKSKEGKSEEGNQPHSLDKSSDEKSVDLKSVEGRKSGEGSVASAELAPKLESKSGERKLSSREKKQSFEEGVSKEGDVKKATKIDEREEKQRRRKKSSSIWKMLILILINILNYLDRMTVAGLLTAIQAFYDVNDTQGGLLWSVYMISATVIAPVWGFFGDRYNRKYLMTAGLVLWTCTVLLSTFVPKDVGVFYLSSYTDV